MTVTNNGNTATKQQQQQQFATLSPIVQDQVATGTIQILNSPHVSEGPGRIANAPVPSVFRDDRGEIHRLRVAHGTQTIRINVIYSKAGVMRSGYLHPLPKKDFVLKGKVEVWYLTETETAKKVFTTLQSYQIEPYVPHILHFLEDTVIAEWWRETHAGDLKCWYYHPYRRIVDVQNSLIAPSTGHFQKLVPQDVLHDHLEDRVVTAWVQRLVWWSTGFVMGAAGCAILLLSRNGTGTSSPRR